MPLNQNLKTPTPVLAVIGVGDLVVEKLRAARTDVQARSSKINVEPRKLQADLEAAARHRLEDVQEAPAKAQAAAQAAFNDALSQAVTAYDGLAGRGQSLVARIRSQQATQDLAKSAGNTKAQAKATSTTAKKSASQTKSRAKATTTSAKKTADAAKKTTAQSADKVGD